MWLLHVQSHELVGFVPGDVPAYAILSHTWGPDEVVFADMQSAERRQAARSKASWRKIEYTWRQAWDDGFAYVWIDSCCIDKSSSAELSEAINSMFAWYRDASICYAYLEGVPADVDATAPDSAFALSRELLGPPRVIFFSDDWTKINDRVSLSLPLAAITGIDEPILAGVVPIRSTSIAKRMSWAARRETTRPEDLAYSLLGIFDVNMPMIYGEGAQNAFLRLQQEIMRTSDDHSLFAWVDSTLPSSNRPQGETLRSLDRTQTLYGLLAPSPSYFENSKTMMQNKMPDGELGEPYTMTNRGLRIDLNLIPLSPKLYMAVLNCPPLQQKDDTFLGLYLRELGPRQFARVGAGFTEIPAKLKRDLGRRETIYVRQTGSDGANRDRFARDHILRLRHMPISLDSPGYMLEFIWDPLGTGAELDRASSSSSYSQTTTPWLPPRLPRSFIVPRGPVGRVAAALLFRRRPDGERLLVLLGLAGIFNLGYQLVELPPPPPSQFGGHDQYCSAASDGDSARRTLLDGQELTRQAAQALFVRRKEALSYHRVQVDFTPHWYQGLKFYMVDVEVGVLQLSNRQSTTTVGQLPSPTPSLHEHTHTHTQLVAPIPKRPSIWNKFRPKSQSPSHPPAPDLPPTPSQQSVVSLLPPLMEPTTPSYPPTQSHGPDTRPVQEVLQTAMWKKLRPTTPSQPPTRSQPPHSPLIHAFPIPKNPSVVGNARPTTRSLRPDTPPMQAVTSSPKKPTIWDKMRPSSPSRSPTPSQPSDTSRLPTLSPPSQPPHTPPVVQAVSPSPKKPSLWQKFRPTTPSRPITRILSPTLSHQPSTPSQQMDTLPVQAATVTPTPKKPSFWEKFRPSPLGQPPVPSQPPTRSEQPGTPPVQTVTVTPNPKKPSIWERIKPSSPGHPLTPSSSQLSTLDLLAPSMQLT